jgi:hypothetical protein
MTQWGHGEGADKILHWKWILAFAGMTVVGERRGDARPTEEKGMGPGLRRGDGCAIFHLRPP